MPVKPLYTEKAIVNLDSVNGPGTHWVAYKKRGNKVQYFDSFGNLQPPQELTRYFRGCIIHFNYNQLQKFDTVNCGHLCIKFLCE